MFKRIAALAANTLLVATVAAASPTAVDRKDIAVAHDIASTVERYTRFTIFDDINAGVKDGVVTLTGRVTMPFKRDEIGGRVAQIDGVRQVINQIGVLPVSQFDDE